MINNLLSKVDEYFFLEGEATTDDKTSFYSIALSVNIVAITMLTIVLSNI